MDRKVGDRAKVQMTNAGGSWWVNATLTNIARNGTGRFDIDKGSASGGGFTYRELDSREVRWI